MVRISALASVLSVAVLLISCSSPYRWVGTYGNGPFDSNGERIYFTAESASDEAITYSGGSSMMHRRVACVNCHGPEGKGGRVTSMMWRFDVPDITWDNLTQDEHGEEELGRAEHEEHPPYIEETLKRAISRGIDPEGALLGEQMPRWQMSEQDLNDLVEFIKTLK